jgi:hypothetical protein
MRKLLSVIYILLFCSFAKAQISVQFLPEINGRNIDGLFAAKFINNGPLKNGLVLKIDVKENRSGHVVSVRVRELTMNSGINQLVATQIRNAYIQFSNSAAAVITKQSNVFPEGDYEYCFTIEDGPKSGTQPQVYADDCFDYDLQPIIPVSLIEPLDGEKVCEPQPLLTWQPIVPQLQGVTYQLTLTELKKEQNPVEALNYNIPLLNSKNHFSPFLPYPNSARPLEKGKSYVWQVSAYIKNMIISRSEIWVFQYGCEDTVKLEKPTGFRSIEDLVLGNYYVANGRILFSLQNAYTETKLKYKIVCLSNPELKIKKLPEIKLVRGGNNIVIELADNQSFVNGYVYQLTVTLPDGAEKQLRFVYQNMVKQ